MRNLGRLVMLGLVTLAFIRPFAAHATDFSEVKRDLKTTIDLLESRACGNPALTEVCVTARTLRPLILERPGPVESILDTVISNIDSNQQPEKWESSWVESGDLVSIPPQFCEDTGIDKGYCKDFRCFIEGGPKNSKLSCPTTSLPTSTKGSTILSSPGFDKICNGDLCFPVDRNKAEARRFIELDLRAMKGDLQSGLNKKQLTRNAASRYRCWVLSEGAIALAASLGLAEEDVRGSLNDCATARTLLAKITNEAQAIQVLTHLNPSDVEVALPSISTAAASADYTVLSATKIPTSLIRGIAARLDRSTTAAATPAAHLFLLVDSSRLPEALGITAAPELDELDLGISIAVKLSSDGTFSVPPGFGKPVLAVDYPRLVTALKRLIPLGHNLALSVTTVILASKLVPISFNASLKLPGIDLSADFGTLQIDCSLSDCGLSELVNGAALRKRLDQEIAHAPRIPSTGSVYLKDLHLCPGEEESFCIVGNFVSPHVGDILGTADLKVKYYPPPNSHAVLVPSTFSESRLVPLHDELTRRLKTLAPSLQDSWVGINEPVMSFKVDVGNGEPTLSWTFSAEGIVRLQDDTVKVPLVISDSRALNLDQALEIMTAQVRDRIAAYAEGVLLSETVDQLDTIKTQLSNVKMFGQNLLPENLSCKENRCSFSLGSWITNVFATPDPDGLAKGVKLCYANASIGSQTKTELQALLPRSDGFTINVDRVSIQADQTACTSQLPKLSVDLAVGLPLLGIEPEAVNILVDPNSASVDAIIPSIVTALRARLLSRAASLKSLPFTIDDVTGPDPILLKGSFSIPNSSAAFLKGRLSVAVYPQFKLSLDCPSGDLGAAVGALLKIPIPIKAQIGGCGIFPVHMQVDLTLPVISNSAKFNVDLGADGHLEISDPIPVPLTPLIVIGSTPLVIRNAQLALYLREAGRFALQGSLQTILTDQLRVDAVFDAKLSEHKLAFKGPLLLAGIQLASLTGSFDGRELLGDAKLLILANAESTFLLRLDPLTYVQTLDVNVWDQLTLSAAFRIETSAGDCGGSGLPTVCLTGKLNVLNIGRGDVVLYVKPKLSDFASLKANVAFGNIAGLGLRASSKLLAVKIDAGIVKLSIVLPGINSLTPEKILAEITDALLKMHMDPQAFLKGDWQVSLGSQSSGSADGYGEVSNGNGEPQTITNQEAEQTTIPGHDNQPVSKGSIAATGTPSGNGQSAGGSEQEPWIAGNCSIHFVPLPGGQYQRQSSCAGTQVLYDPCLWTAAQTELVRGRPGVLMLPEALNVGGGYPWPDFRSKEAVCFAPQYRLYVASRRDKSDCATGVCVLQIGGSVGTDTARDLGSADLLHSLLRTQEDPASYLTAHKGAAFTAQQWRVFYTLAHKAWNPTDGDIQGVSCYLPASDHCEMFLVSRATASDTRYSLISESGETSVSAASAAIKITAVKEFARVADGVVSTFDTASGQMIGWWNFTATEARVNVVSVPTYLSRRECWRARQDAPTPSDSVHLMTDFDFFDGISTVRWKQRGWRKNPLLLFVDASCN